MAISALSPCTTAVMHTLAIRGSVGRGAEVDEMANEQWPHELVVFVFSQRLLTMQSFGVLLQECENSGETRIGCC